MLWFLPRQRNASSAGAHGWRVWAWGALPREASRWSCRQCVFGALHFSSLGFPFVLFAVRKWERGWAVGEHFQRFPSRFEFQAMTVGYDFYVKSEMKRLKKMVRGRNQTCNLSHLIVVVVSFQGVLSYISYLNNLNHINIIILYIYIYKL